jgi:2TM domain
MYGHERRLRDRDGPTDEVIGEREAAKRRVRTRRDFTSDLVAFAVLRAALVVIWALSGAGYFWRAWIIGIWVCCWSSTGGTPSVGAIGVSRVLEVERSGLARQAEPVFGDHTLVHLGRTPGDGGLG